MLTYLFAFLFSRGENSKDSMVSAMTAILPISVFSLMTYGTGEIFTSDIFLNIALPAAIGGILGAFVGNKLRVEILRRIFAVLVIYSGVKSIL